MTVESTSSRGTRRLGLAALAAIAVLAVLALAVSPDDSEMGDLVRLLYVHVPAAWIAYLAFIVAGVGSLMYLFKKSEWWDLVALSSAEIGLVACGLMLVTGMIWGKPTWGTYWQWTDARLVTSLVLFLMFVAYFAVRQAPGDPTARSRRAAFVALIALVDIPLIHFSVTWWRTLHQEATVLSPDLDPKLDDLMLFTLFWGVLTFTLVYLWLMTHRFRVAWLESRLESSELDVAITERRAEALVGPSSAGAET